MKTENGAATEYVYNSLNQLVSDSETSYEYDLNGNLVRVIGSANSALYEYNAENKLVKATVQNGSLVIEESYTYDYAGNRTSKTTRRSDGVTEYVKYLNDNSSLTNVLAEIDSEGNAVACYTIGDDVVSQDREGRTSFYLYDGHGSVTALANESGKVTDTYSYDAFGNLLKSTGDTANNYRYCGEQFDETTGLYYLRARYMDTTTGRFISQDTYQGSIYDPVSLHKYLYCGTNPVMYSDASGYSERLDSVLAATAGVAVQNTMIVPNFSVIITEFLNALPTIMSIASGFGAILLNNPAFVDICTQFADGTLSVYDLQQQILETFQTIEQELRDLIYEAKKDGSSASKTKSKSKPKSKDRSKSPPARRVRCKSKKEAYEKAKRAGKDREPIQHHNDPNGPHYHPDVPNTQRTTPHNPSSHDHYFYPG